MPKQSAGILMYRDENGVLEVLLVHPGGPLWSRRDEGAWSIPKGELDGEDDILKTARREFAEELGTPISGEFIRLKTVRQKSGKLVHAFAVEGDFDPTGTISNTFQQEWPPRSGKMREFPEVDRAEWFDLATARKKINPGQTPLIDELEAWLK